MFRFTIRDVLWLTVVVAMAVMLFRDRVRVEALRATLEQERAELSLKRAEAEKEWAYLVKAATQAELNRSMDLRTAHQQYVAKQTTAAELERIKKRSAELGAPQPKPLPPGFGENSN